MHRLFFLRSFQGLFLFKDRLQVIKLILFVNNAGLNNFENLTLQSSALAGDWMQGLLLSILVVGVFLAVSALRDYLVRMDMHLGDAFAEPHPQQQQV